MRKHSWLPLGLLAAAVSFSTYACGGDDPDNQGDDAGSSSGAPGSSSSSGVTSSSSGSSNGGSSGVTSSSSGGSSGETSSSGGSSGETSSSSGGSSGETDAGDAGESDASDAGADADSGPVDPPTPEVQFLGRWKRAAGGEASASWPGAKAVVRFRGTALSATIAQTNATIGTSRFDVVVDGQVRPGVNANEVAALVVQTGSNVYPIVAGLADAEHVVEIVRRTEPQQGITTFSNWTFPGGGELLAPPARPQRRIEILTESTSNGYGVDSPLKLAVPNGGNYEGSRACADVAVFNNGRRSFGSKLAERFDAELSLLGMSAIGIRSNAGGNQAFKFGTFYPRINPILDDANNLWSFAEAPADVVMILLGGADFTAAQVGDPSQPPFEYLDGDVLVNPLDALVTQVRNGNPNAYIFLVVGPQVKNSYPGGMNQRTELLSAFEAVEAMRNDPKVNAVEMTENNTQALEVGCAYHASEQLHTLMANQAEAWIEAATGWQAEP